MCECQHPFISKSYVFKSSICCQKQHYSIVGMESHTWGSQMAQTALQETSQFYKDSEAGSQLHCLNTPKTFQTHQSSFKGLALKSISNLMKLCISCNFTFPTGEGFFRGFLCVFYIVKHVCKHVLYDKRQCILKEPLAL